MSSYKAQVIGVPGAERRNTSRCGVVVWPRVEEGWLDTWNVRKDDV